MRTIWKANMGRVRRFSLTATLFVLAGGTMLLPIDSVPAPAAAPVLLLNNSTADAVDVSEASGAPMTRNRKFNTYRYTCAGFSPSSTLKNGMVGTHYFVYEGWNYDISYDGGETWRYAYSWVYPSGQAGPAQITRQYEYTGPFTLQVAHRPCPAR